MDYKVIVSVNQNVDHLTTADKYKLLFAKAYAALAAKNQLKITHTDDTFHSIDEYFHHMEELYAIDRTYAMLPLDETPFAIDANKRLISNPKIVVMQNDHNSEVVLFTIDRYFDSKDLNTSQIYVQWTLPDGTEGASEVKMRDLSIPGKIRFGWSLTNRITAQKGVVKFSVRFWNIGKVDGVDAIVYSFNTQTSTLTITESLQPQLNDATSVDDPHGDSSFKKAIINGSVVNENMAIPLNPRFDEPGLNLNPYESLTNDTLTLMAQAINSDTGELTYEWWYKPAEDGEGSLSAFKANNWYPYESKIDVDGSTIPGFKAYNGKTGETYVDAGLADTDPLESGATYYVLSDGTYSPYTGDSAVPHSDLWKKVETYTVPDSGKVTGQYKISATNTIGSNISTVVDSRVCQLVSPEDITFNKNGDLDATATIYRGDDGEWDATKLVVDLKADDSIGVQRTYSWIQKKQPNAAGSQVGTAATLETADPGWYQLSVASTLNRETKTLESTVCKLAYDTIAPAVATDDVPAPMVQMAYGAVATAQEKDKNGLPEYPDGGANTLDVVVTVNGMSGYSNELFSEELSYAWGYQIGDGKFTYLTDKDAVEGGLVISGLGTPTLVVNNLEDGRVYTYKCIITNRVNGKTAACSESNALAFNVH